MYVPTIQRLNYKGQESDNADLKQSYIHAIFDRSCFNVYEEKPMLKVFCFVFQIRKFVNCLFWIYAIVRKKDCIFKLYLTQINNMKFQLDWIRA